MGLRATRRGTVGAKRAATRDGRTSQPRGSWPSSTGCPTRFSQSDRRTAQAAVRGARFSTSARTIVSRSRSRRFGGTGTRVAAGWASCADFRRDAVHAGNRWSRHASGCFSSQPVAASAPRRFASASSAPTRHSGFRERLLETSIPSFGDAARCALSILRKRRRSSICVSRPTIGCIRGCFSLKGHPSQEIHHGKTGVSSRAAPSRPRRSDPSWGSSISAPAPRGATTTRDRSRSASAVPSAAAKPRCCSRSAAGFAIATSSAS